MLDQVMNDISEWFTPHQRQSLMLFNIMPHNALRVSWDDQVKPVVDKFGVYLDPCDHIVKNEFFFGRRTAPLLSLNY